MRFGRLLPWLLIAAAVVLGLYSLIAPKDTAPEAPPVAAAVRPQIAPAPQIDTPVPPEVTETNDTLNRDAKAAFDEIQRKQDEETAAMPPAPPDMGMDKSGIAEDKAAADAAAAKAKKP